MVDDVKIEEILRKTRQRKDFQGMSFFANYYDDFSPYCYVDSEGRVKGLFKDAMEIVATQLNLTLVLKSPKIENKNSWFSK